MMTSRLRFSGSRASVVLIVSLLCVINGCTNTANTRVDGEKEYSYTQFIDRLLVVERFPAEMEEMSSAMTDQMQTRLSAHNRSVTTLHLPVTDSTMLDSAAVRSRSLQAARDEGATQVLILDRLDSDVVMSSVGDFMQSYNTYEFTASVYDVASGDRVFVGTLDTHAQGGAGGGERFGRGVGDDIVDALIEYSLLPHTMME
ncbi:MAG: hypothetical protein GVY25_11760 [Bacteroidetes bacterium]|jgi:hypothetical protein|nr:hypothetical protein [Bacteroidota bacterium]